ncbi:hypothetical protein [Methanobrevibacter sp.]|uniref:hypothetical protein n=1 Tax=Methanobrevibacter sp. TaxID=66852 RepID=UPI0025D10D68|nr:hypothetical protein [uncultured Methanobrevibacter sp.]
MNFNLFLIILIALIIIFLIILYNGIRLLLTVAKEKGIVKYEFKVTILKIAIFTRKGTEEIIDSIRSKKDEDSEEDDEESKSEENEEKSESEGEEDGDKKGLKEKYEEIKPILKELKKSKEELKGFLKNILKAIDLKKLEGNLIIGLNDHTTTVKIASWIWSIGAIVNSSKPTQLSVDPRFNEVITDFEGKIELKINILLLLIHSLTLLTKKNIRELIKELYIQKKSKDNAKNESINDNEQKTKK